VTGRRVRLGSVLFWIFFVPYAIGVAVWLSVGLVPSVVHESPSLHTGLHDRSGDALRANQEVTIHFGNLDPEQPNNITLLGSDDRVLFAGEDVVAPHDARYRFAAPAPGSYRIVSDQDDEDDEFAGELRFTDDGAPSLSVHVDEFESRFVKHGVTGWDGLAQRVADASHEADHGARVTLETLFSVLNLGLGVLLVVRRPRDRTARLLAVAMIGTAATFNHQSHAMLQHYLLGDWWTQHILFHLTSGIAYMFAVVTFPDGRLVPFTRTAWDRTALRVAYGVAAVVISGFVLVWSDVSHPGQSFFTVLFGLAIPLVGVAAQTYRLRHTEDAVRRQQSRLLRWALLPMLAFGVVYLVLIGVFGTSSIGASYGVTASDSLVEEIGLAVFPALFALVPLALVMGILRYRLWEIDVLVSKTLLSVGLIVFIGTVYVVVVVVLGRAVGPGDSAAFKIVATAIAAVAFEPVRERLERLANRLVYGERATPYEVVADFADRLSSVISVDEVLPRTAEAVAVGVGAAATRVTAFLPGGGERSTRWPPGDTTTSFTRLVAVTHAGRPVGEIAVAKGPGEHLTPVENGLLTSLGAQAGLAFYNARLTLELEDRLEEVSAQAADLRASRQRIVTAREVLRQRVVEIIHDRVETHLLAADAQLEQVQGLLPGHPEQALDCFDVLLAEGGESLDALRDLARGIFPAVLADQGVLAALHAHLLQADLAIEVDIEGWPERFDPDAEARIYFCVVQALANAGKYAPGSSVTVRLDAGDHRLEFSVADDGPGVDPVRLNGGADIQDMRDRVEAVDGGLVASSEVGQGTVVSGWVPARAPVGVG
jgi:signal transduction histidine kinase